MTHEQKIVAPLLTVTMMSLALLFGVSYTNASLYGSSRSVPDYTQALVPVSFNSTLTTIGTTFAWAVQSSVTQAQAPVMAFLGLDSTGYTNAIPQRYAEVNQLPNHASAVLGASTQNPQYSEPGD